MTTHKLVIRSIAERELNEAYLWYEDKQPGLGQSFLEHIQETFESICDTPEMYAIALEKIRRAGVRRFPYGVYYRSDKDRIVVLAVFHGRRDSQSLSSRS